MGNVNADGIWTPDEGDTVDPEVYLATMADSISEGIGVRLTAQEVAIGLKAGITGGTLVPYTSGVTAPYEILSSGECYTEGLTLSGGVATVAVAGLYYFSASASLEPYGTVSTNENRTIALQLYKNSTQLNGCEVQAVASTWATAQANAGVRCVPGDTLYVRYYSAGPVSGEGNGTLASNEAMNSLSIVLVTPVAA